MIFAKWVPLLIGLLISVVVFLSHAEETADTKDRFLPTDSLHASWLFSGVVTNEHGDNYGYFFQMQRDNDKFHATAALFDEESKTTLLVDENEALIRDPLSYNWRVGRAFLRFNPINDSWIFGLKSQGNKGFNFKVDMLNPPENSPVAQSLRKGVELLVSQSTHLNGHVQVGEGDKEEFVTAKNAWFRQVWLTEEQAKSHSFSGVLCRFDDGSGFYSMKTAEADALRGAVAGWCDQNGTPGSMSQFIHVKQATVDGPWHIRIASPNLHLVLSDMINQNSVIAGFVASGSTPGFCMLTKDMIGGEAVAAS